MHLYAQINAQANRSKNLNYLKYGYRHNNHKSKMHIEMHIEMHNVMHIINVLLIFIFKKSCFYHS